MRPTVVKVTGFSKSEIIKEAKDHEVDVIFRMQDGDTYAVILTNDSNITDAILLRLKI